LDIRIPDGYALRFLESSRHIVGWCAKALDFCGEPYKPVLAHNSLSPWCKSAASNLCVRRKQ
jgi:hypothetical protein